jgi:ketosteroid isomerase-like protein
MARAAADSVAVVRLMLDTVARGDREAFLECLTRDVEWDDREGWPGVRRMYHGRAQAGRWLEKFISVGGEILDAEIEDLAEASGNRVLLGVLGTFRSRAEGTATEFKARAWYVFWLRGGQVARAQLFWDRRQALEASGLLEQERGG